MSTHLVTDAKPPWPRHSIARYRSSRMSPASTRWYPPTRNSSDAGRGPDIVPHIAGSRSSSSSSRPSGEKLSWKSSDTTLTTIPLVAPPGSDSAASNSSTTSSYGRGELSLSSFFGRFASTFLPSSLVLSSRDRFFVAVVVPGAGAVIVESRSRSRSRLDATWRHRRTRRATAPRMERSRRSSSSMCAQSRASRQVAVAKSSARAKDPQSPSQTA
mmetsp:Transcript_35667/g.114052  ORF Transcript_35667/g.114052 Transcript_35667/m.114052 type:complete len:215 (+) Transcript_35667:799-1443(+)